MNANGNTITSSPENSTIRGLEEYISPLSYIVYSIYIYIYILLYQDLALNNPYNKFPFFRSVWFFLYLVVLFFLSFVISRFSLLAWCIFFVIFHPHVLTVYSYCLFLILFHCWQTACRRSYTLGDWFFSCDLVSLYPVGAFPVIESQQIIMEIVYLLVHIFQDFYLRLTVSSCCQFHSQVFSLCPR